MNKVFRIIWSRVKKPLVVGGENAKSCG
ncbi:MAG: hypothetical protein EA373_01690, partial [Oceanospirillales bacterium]